MRHYTALEWSNLVRGVSSKEDERLMRTHLETGCRKCAKEFAIWQRVSAAAKRQLAVEPSEGSVRQAKALFAMNTLTKPRKSLIAQLLFDSSQTPLAVGVRSGFSGSRQLLFSAGEHRIDLRMDAQAGSQKLAIVGQFLDAARPEKMVDKVPVFLHTGPRIVAAAETNHLGEFQFECDAASGLELRAALPNGHEILVTLIDDNAMGRYSSEFKGAGKAMKGGGSTRKGV
jgi:hypothetical protein